MSTLANSFDSIEQLIFQQGLKIEAVDFHPKLDIMLIILNSKTILQRKISSFKNLRTTDNSKLTDYQLIGNGIGIHWPQLDEDLSLKGFLKEELLQLINKGDGTYAMNA